MSERKATAVDDPAFLAHEYFDCLDSERLSCNDPVEALEEYLDCYAEPGVDMEEVIRDLAPFTVTACDREPGPGPEFVKSIAEGFLERAVELWDEDFGDPEGEHASLTYAMQEAMLPEMAALLAKFYAMGKVWRCEQVAKVELDAEQVLVLMRKWREDWFEKPDVAKVPTPVAVTKFADIVGIDSDHPATLVRAAEDTLPLCTGCRERAPEQGLPLCIPCLGKEAPHG